MAHAHRPSSSTFDAGDRHAPTSELSALPGWIRRPVERWGVVRGDRSWVGGVLAGVAARHGFDPLLTRGVFVALCFLSSGLGLVSYAAAWAVLPDARGRVPFARLRRGDWGDSGVLIGVIGGIGALNMLFGVGFASLLVPGVGGIGTLVGMAGIGVLVWWLLTRWDPRAQRGLRPEPTAAERPARPAVLEDPSGFRSDWVDPQTGQWRDHVHSRDVRAAARLREQSAAVPARRAPRTQLGLLPQAGLVLGAGVLGLLAALVALLGNVGLVGAVLTGGIWTAGLLTLVLAAVLIMRRRALGVVVVWGLLLAGLLATVGVLALTGGVAGLESLIGGELERELLSELG